MRTVVSTLAQQIGTQRACEVLAYPRSSYYRHQRPAAQPADSENRPPAVSPRALSATERESVRETLNGDRFMDCSPRQVYGTLLDEEVYLCTVGYMIADRELAALAKQRVADSCAKQGIVPEQLILYADRGSSMTSKTLAQAILFAGVFRFAGDDGNAVDQEHNVGAVGEAGVFVTPFAGDVELVVVEIVKINEADAAFPVLGGDKDRFLAAQPGQGCLVAFDGGGQEVELAQDFVSGRIVHDAGVEGKQLLAENVAEEKAALPTAPLKRLPPADRLPADLTGVVDHGVLDGRCFRHDVFLTIQCAILYSSFINGAYPACVKCLSGVRAC
jgi:hypothetical protein